MSQNAAHALLGRRGPGLFPMLTAVALAALVPGAATATETATSAPAISTASAFRFLNQATFGSTEKEVARLKSLGDSSVGYQRWIDLELAKPVSLTLPVLLDALEADPSLLSSTAGTQAVRQDIWMRNAVVGPDQLRQRVAFALSEVFVVGLNRPISLADYYDVLSRNAFGSFRVLLEEVTLHPAMGAYLSMLGNQKPDLAGSIRPDENFAREVMQLFTIGLVQLNLDGTPKLDAEGRPIPTYDQSVVEGFAHAFTGWSFAGGSSFGNARLTLESQVQPMQAYPEQHATGSKKLLTYPGVARPLVPAGQSPRRDLADALDNLFHHPNVGPFISQRLIQRLVTSNPSPQYIARVATVFNNDGTGRRGNLAAVVRAILLDKEARPATPTMRTGKAKEPLLRVTQLWRAYDATPLSGRYRLLGPMDLGQQPLQAPSVFNFFTPDYAPPGEISAAGLVAPELEIATDYLNTSVTNTLATLVSWNTGEKSFGSYEVRLDVSAELKLAGKPGSLVTKIANRLLGAKISKGLRDETVAAVTRIPAIQPGRRVTEALYLIVTSPEYAVQR